MAAIEILAQIPLSGTVDEVHFEATGSCFWIHFTDDVHSEWCGVFGPGCGSHSDASVNDRGLSFVISRGQGYLVDINTRRLLHKTETEWLESAISIPGSDFFVTCDFTDLYVYSPKGLLWRSDRVSVDGIKFTSVDKERLEGQVWNMTDWSKFTLEIDGWKYQSDFECKY